MRALVTLDKYDGTQGKTIECDLDGFPTQKLMFAMLDSDVCGFTVTKIIKVAKLQEKMKCE